jgi:hypothetical protein
MNPLTAIARFSIVLLLSGCGAGGLSAVREHASREMSCPATSLTVTAEGAQGVNTNLYYAEGCQQVHRYVTACNVFGYCPTVQGVDALGLVKRQAVFDLRCDDANVATKRLNADTFGATGCGRQASYALACRLSTDCRVIQNTQTQ